LVRDVDDNLLPLLIEKYGFRLTTAHLASLLNTTPNEIRRRISAGTFPIRTAKEYPESRRSPRYADVRDVAAYLDASRPKADAQDAEGSIRE
jgi:hypothetical protein